MSGTVVVQIGNSDDHLAQTRWANYVREVRAAITPHAAPIWFEGLSPADAPWQNACWVFELISDTQIHAALKGELGRIAAEFGQDAIAWTTGETVMVFAEPIDLSDLVDAPRPEAA